MTQVRWSIRLARTDGEWTTTRWYGGECVGTGTLVVRPEDAFQFSSRVEAENLAQTMRAAGLADDIDIIDALSTADED
jgi:hypothetical protein